MKQGVVIEWENVEDHHAGGSNLYVLPTVVLFFADTARRKEIMKRVNRLSVEAADKERGKEIQYGRGKR